MHVFADRDICRPVDTLSVVVMPHSNFYAGRYCHDDKERHTERSAGPNADSYEKNHYMADKYPFHRLPPTIMPAPACSNTAAFETGEGRRRPTVIGRRSKRIVMVNPLLGWRGGALVCYENKPAFEVKTKSYAAPYRT